MVGTAGRVVAHYTVTQIRKGAEPGREDGLHRYIAFSVDAAESAAAVVHVEIGRKFLIVRFGCDRPAGIIPIPIITNT